jgi:hypothetical protein
MSDDYGEVSADIISKEKDIMVDRSRIFKLTYELDTFIHESPESEGIFAIEKAINDIEKEILRKQGELLHCKLYKKRIKQGELLTKLVEKFKHPVADGVAT